MMIASPNVRTAFLLLCFVLPTCAEHLQDGHPSTGAAEDNVFLVFCYWVTQTSPLPNSLKSILIFFHRFGLKLLKASVAQERKNTAIDFFSKVKDDNTLSVKTATGTSVPCLMLVC